MNDPIRMKKLNDAWELINSASHEEQKELFQEYIQAFKKLKARFDEPDNRFDPYSYHAYRGADLLETIVRRLTGYNAGWTLDKFLEHSSENVGRNAKYNSDDRQVNCAFITHMVNRGASETQAMKLLCRLKGDVAMSSGLMRELQDTYRDYKKIYNQEEYAPNLYDRFDGAPYFLEYSISNLEGDELASKKAVDAFRAFFQELIDGMKSIHKTIAKNDDAYPDIFGCVIDWVNSEYDDPLDYFYTHETHQQVPFPQRRRFLNEYVNTMHFYMEHPGKH